MIGVKELRRPDDRGRGAGPSDEEFVVAVIRIHERLHANLRALALGGGRVLDPVDPGEGEVIRAYCAAHGVEAPEYPAREVGRRYGSCGVLPASTTRSQMAL